MRRSGGTTADAGDGRNVDGRNVDNGRFPYASEATPFFERLCTRASGRKMQRWLSPIQIGRAQKRGKRKCAPLHPETVMKKAPEGPTQDQLRPREDAWASM
jgi:hypothetical protein